MPEMKGPTVVGALVVVIAFAGSGWSQAGDFRVVFPSDNGRALSGVTSVNAITLVGSWPDIELDRERCQGNAQRTFDRGLRGNGVAVDPAASNVLTCQIAAVYALGESVAYTSEVRFYTNPGRGLLRLEWEAGHIVTIGLPNFNAQEAATLCVDAFSAEWLKWNPGR